MPTLAIDGRRLSYEDYGSGRSLAAAAALEGHGAGFVERALGHQLATRGFGEL